MAIPHEFRDWARFHDGIPLHQRNDWIGEWWLPDDPQHALIGVLRYEPQQGLTLDIEGSFEDREFERTAEGARRFRNRYRTFDVVHGSWRGTPVTLHEVFALSTNRGRFAHQQLSVSQALVGIHMNNPENAELSGAAFGLEELRVWSGHESIKLLEPSDEHPGGALTYEFGPTQTGVSEDWSIELLQELTHGTPEHERGSSAAGFLGHASVIAASHKRVTVNGCLDLVATVAELLALAIGRDPGLLWLTLIVAGDTQLRPVNFIARWRTTPRPQEQGLKQHEFIFTLADVPLSSLFPLWMQIRRRFRSAKDVFIASMLDSDGYVEPRLASAVSMAESFHHALGLTRPEDDESRHRSALLQKALKVSTDKRDRSLLKRSLAPLQFSMKERLQGIAGRLPEAIRDAILQDAAGREAWARMTRDARNKITHEGSSGFEGHQLLGLTRATQALVHLNFLVELGIPSDVIERALAQSPVFKTAAFTFAEYVLREHQPKEDQARGSSNGPEPSPQR